jgi:hypothetical protein
MTPSGSNSPQWQQHWQPSGHSNEVEHRLTITELKVSDLREDHDELAERTTSKILWLERGLQALAYIVLTLMLWSAPEKAQAIAQALLTLIKR